MGKLYLPPREPEAVWTVDAVGKAFLTLTTFGALIALVGFASCWEAIPQ